MWAYGEDEGGKGDDGVWGHMVKRLVMVCVVLVF